MPPLLIGISGAKDHGKSVLAEKLRKRLKQSVQWEFADPMTDMAKILTQDKKFSKFEKYELVPGQVLTGTEILQKLGTNAIRDVFGEDVWVHFLIRLVNDKFAHFDYVFVPGVRMPKESEIMHVNIWIEAEGVTTSQNVNHRTENHHELLRSGAQMHVVRKESTYGPSLDAIAEWLIKEREERFPSPPAGTIRINKQAHYKGRPSKDMDIIEKMSDDGKWGPDDGEPGYAFHCKSDLGFPMAITSNCDCSFMDATCLKSIAMNHVAKINHAANGGCFPTNIDDTDALP